MHRIVISLLIVLFAVAVTAGADEKTAEAPPKAELTNRVEVVLHPGTDTTKAVAVISASHVNPLRSFSVPLRFIAGEDSVWIDSVSFAAAAVEFFKKSDYKLYPKRNAVMILMLTSAKDKQKAILPPGESEIARIYLSAASTFPTEQFRMGPVKLPPDNTLMFVTDVFQSVEPVFDFHLAGKKPELKPLTKDK